ncbi:hypothetical protein [Rickettsia montanensis]|uniref:Uncharacterized protein n=1 Tax=Rickettsia montanensis (strain OSU 85-930) TaxID=1105114 RepID=H8KB14_RICMS|nr:hypothetical protein [Rickettsia montanensis]AFC73680.1 hypothetical protein MCI_04180 [Rickettsia montanensis str. OSU 85-930]
MKKQLATHDLHRGKSWIISEAIRIYLKQLEELIEAIKSWMN